MYYLGSRYYDAEIGRFINADGYVSTGVGLVGHNMFVYCNSNPVNMIDIGGSMPTGIADANLPYYNIVIPDKEDFIKDSLSPTVELTANVTGKLLKNEPRPNNVGVGTWNKHINNQIKNINTLSKNVTGFLDKLDYIEVVVETSSNIYKNAVNGKRLRKIAWDATIDTVILSANVCTASAVGASLGSAIGTVFGPGYGTIAGAVVGGVVGLGLAYLSDRPRRYLKTWVN